MHSDSSGAVRILNGFRHQRVLIVGDVMLDRYLWGTVTRVSPEAPVPIVAKQRTSSSPGGAANVAVTVAALGGHPVLVSAAGESPEGRELHAALAERGVGSADVILSPRRRTTVKTRIIAHNQQLLRIDEEDTNPIDPELVDELLARIEARLPSVTAVILSDYAKGVLAPPFLSEIICRSRRLGVPVLVDPKGSDFSRYNGASLLTPNRAEAFLSAGFHQNHGARVVDAGAHLMDSLAIDALLITEGESGMTLFERRDSAIHLPASARVVYDVTGAGDAVIATLGLALGVGGSLRMATYLANLAGGLAVQQVGTATITAAALESVLGDHHHSLPFFSEVPVAKGVQ
jgi:rfaE bifunctional protein kinase chain/domain